MELIATSDQQLRHLGYHDLDLAPYFAGVFAIDRHPTRPVEDGPRGYIVNIDKMFRTPVNILVVCPSGSGKTVFVSELLKEPHRYFRPVSKRLHYCYGAMQPLLQQLRDGYKVGLHEGLPTATDLARWFGNKSGILVLDDLMAEGGNDKQVLDLFTKHSHHRNITVIYLCQDTFPREKYAKTINRQAHYIVAFKSARDKLGLKNLFLQAFSNRWKDVMEMFDRATRRPFGYTMLDLHPASDDRMRVFADLLHKEGITKAYRIKENDDPTRAT